MIKQAMEKVEALVLQGSELKDVNGRKYSRERLYEVKPERNKIEYYTVNSLQSLVKFVKKYHQQFGELEVIVDDYDKVVVKSPLILDENVRDTLVVAHFDISHRWLNNYIDPEEMIINLRRNCVETEKLKNVIDIVSGISDKAEVQTTDDGIGQKTTIVKGSVVMGQVEIKGIIPLKVFRTFSDINVLEEPFILRVKNGRVALFTTNADMYKVDYINSIRNYLEANIKEEGVMIL